MRGSSQTPRIRWNRPPNRVGPPREWSQPARRAGSDRRVISDDSRWLRADPHSVHKPWAASRHPQPMRKAPPNGRVVAEARAMNSLPPRHPFARADMPRLGISPGDLRQWARTGLVRPVFYGGYLPDVVTDSIEMRAGLGARLLPEGHIVSGRTAAWLYGVDTYAW